MTPNERVFLAALVAGTGVYVSYRFRDDVTSQVALVGAFGIAQWLLASAHQQAYE